MAADDEVYHTVDGLFTAVTAHDEKQLGCFSSWSLVSSCLNAGGTFERLMRGRI